MHEINCVLSNMEFLSSNDRNSFKKNYFTKPLKMPPAMGRKCPLSKRVTSWISTAGNYDFFSAISNLFKCFFGIEYK